MKALLLSGSTAAAGVVELSRVEVSRGRFGGWVGVFVVKSLQSTFTKLGAAAGRTKFLETWTPSWKSVRSGKSRLQYIAPGALVAGGILSFICPVWEDFVPEGQLKIARRFIAGNNLSK
jgi:hypothetical protein